MALPKIFQKLFANSGAGPKLREDIMPRDYLSTAGGTMTGVLYTSQGRSFCRSVDNSLLQINGGTAWEKGASLELYGQDETSNLGRFSLAAKSPTARSTLLGDADGTLTWCGRNIVRSINGNAADVSGNITPQKTGCLPLSGGTLTGEIKVATTRVLSRTVDNGQIQINGGTSYETGASLNMFGKDVNGGGFSLTANNGTNGTGLDGKANGSLTWAGKEIERVNNAGTGYVRYETGLQICWGVTSIQAAETTTVNFPVAFSSAPSLAAANSTHTFEMSVGSTSSFTIYVPTQLGSAWNVRWIAIGKWK